MRSSAISLSKALALRWRPMREQDLENVVRLEQSVHAAPWTLGNFRDALNAGYSVRLGELDHALVAYGVLVLGAGEAQLLNLSVASHAQRSGFGGTLLDYFIDQAAHLGAQQMFLEVRVSNLAAIALYRSRGFVSVARRVAYYPGSESREDALVMRRPLDHI